MSNIQLHDLHFEPFIADDSIRQTVDALAARIDHDYEGKNPIVLVILNGAFIFAADLVRKISIPIRLDFVKVRSYNGTQSTAQMTEHFLWQSELADQHVIILEDIVDTGHTLTYLKKKIELQHPASIEVTCLLFKPEAYQFHDPIRYAGMEIPSDFVVGYGLDYDGLGRDLPHIYKKTTS